MNPLLQYPDPTLYGSQDFSAITGMMAFFAAFFIIFLVVALVAYIYMALTMMKTAQKIKVGPAWLAWIPVANVYLMLKMGKQPWWPMLLMIGFIIPFVNFIAAIVLMIFVIMSEWKICEQRKRPGWWAIITIIPFVGGIWSIILWGILAWGK
jgi:hypothetical protein